MLKKFCPKCAKETDHLFEGVCSECYLKTKKIIEAPPNINVLLCACGRSNDKKRWTQDTTTDDMITRIVDSNIKKDKDTTVTISYKPFTVTGKTRIPVTIVAEKRINSKKITKSATLDLTITPQACDVCSRHSGGYYEAIIQVRGPQYRQKQILDQLKRLVSQYRETDSCSFITRIQTLKEGTDIYLGSAKVAQKIRHETKRIYNVTSKITHKLCGTKDGKKLKRVTILLKASD